MARAPKTNETATENKEGTAPKGETAATDTGNKGTADNAGSDEPVKDPDGNLPDPNAPAPEGNGDGADPELATLKAENERLQGELNLATDEVAAAQERERVANLELEEVRNAANPLAGDLKKANDEIDRLTTELNDLLNAEPIAKDDFDGSEPVEGRERLARGYLLGVVMGMPENYRLNGLAAKLDELELFVSEFEGEDRYIAVELIKSIALARPNDIPSGRYLIDVRRAFAVLDGENEASIDAVANRDEQNAAYNRLASVVGASPVPAGFVAERHGREEQPDPVLDGTAEQNDAASRFARAAG